MEAVLDRRRIVRPRPRATVPRIAAPVIEKKRPVLGRYLVAEWDEVMLSGSEHTIPAVCPACLAPAQTEIRTCYRNWHGLASESAHQSFLYCADCAPMARADSDIGAATWHGALIAVLLAPAFRDGLSDGRIGATLACVLLALGFFAMLGLKHLLRARARDQHPRPAAAAQWGAAAYFIGHTLLGGKSRYRAVRAGWLKLLVERNYEHADAQTRARFGVPAHGPAR